MDARAHCVRGGCRHAVVGCFRRSLIRSNCAILSIRIRRATELEGKDAHAKNGCAVRVCWTRGITENRSRAKATTSIPCGFGSQFRLSRAKE